MKHALPLILALTLAGPAFAQDDPEPSWNLVTDGGEAFLTYAIPDSDDGGPTFSCAAGSKAMKARMWVEKRLATDEPTSEGIWVDAKGRPAPWPGDMTVYAGAARASFPALVHPEEMYGGSMVEAQIPLDSVSGRAFRASGMIQLEAFGEKTRLPTAPTAQIAALLKVCG